MTDRTSKDNNKGKEAPKRPSAHPDPRIVAFVRLLARRTAERDYARLIKAEAVAQNTKNDRSAP